MNKWIKRIMVSLFIVLFLLSLTVYLYLKQEKFGQMPQGQRLERIEQSPHYHDHQFQNLSPITVMKEGGGIISSSLKFIFSDRSLATPQKSVPIVKTDLKALDPAKDVVIWLGHSSYFIRLHGKTILIDPVLSENAAPIPWANRAFNGSNIYTPDDFPEIDFLLISHDHWDHLDHPTVKALQNRVKQVVTGLGVGAHFERWGYDDSIVHELDWYEQMHRDADITVHYLPAQHFSGRSFKRNQTLWGGFAIVTPKHKLFFSGDSGYASHFSEIGKRFDGFDLVMLDSGQYDDDWPAVHMTPEQASQAASDLQAKSLLPGHIGKFSIAHHSWDDPFKRNYSAAQQADYQLLSPMIGQPFYLDGEEQTFEPWWQNIAQ